MITGDPITVTNAMITSSTVPYPDSGETLWVSSTSYAAGATVSYVINGIAHKFMSKQDTNQSHIPKAYPADANDPWWIDLGYVNKLAPFQADRNTQLVTNSPYVVELTTGKRVGAIAIGNVVADTVTVEVLDGATVIYTDTRELFSRMVYNWYTWTYAPFDQIDGTLYSSIPILSSYKIRLTFTKASGQIKVGSIIPAVPFDIGLARFGANISRINFSSFDRDEFGETKIDIKRNIPRVDFELIIDKGKLNSVKRLIDKLNGKVTFWAGIVEANHGYFESVYLIGLYKEFSYVIDQPGFARARIEIEAL